MLSLIIFHSKPKILHEVRDTVLHWHLGRKKLVLISFFCDMRVLRPHCAFRATIGLLKNLLFVLSEKNEACIATILFPLNHLYIVLDKKQTASLILCYLIYSITL